MEETNKALYKCNIIFNMGEDGGMIWEEEPGMNPLELDTPEILSQFGVLHG